MARRKAAALRVAGQPYPWFHPGYGNHAEELFFHTSRYYAQTETFLRALADDPSLEMAGYSADRLSVDQRKVLACLLSAPPTPASGRHIRDIVRAVRTGLSTVNTALLGRFGQMHCGRLAHHLHPAAGRRPSGGTSVPATDPFENLAHRLGIPVQVRGRSVRTSFIALARHLDSANPAIRDNLQAAILHLHRGGYRLRRMHLR